VDPRHRALGMRPELNRSCEPQNPERSVHETLYQAYDWSRNQIPRSPAWTTDTKSEKQPHTRTLIEPQTVPS